jgi:hypothetical protein
MPNTGAKGNDPKRKGVDYQSNGGGGGGLDSDTMFRELNRKRKQRGATVVLAFLDPG